MHVVVSVRGHGQLPLNRALYAFQRFVDNEAFEEIKKRSIFVHIDLPGHEEGADALPESFTYPTIQVRPSPRSRKRLVSVTMSSFHGLAEPRRGRRDCARPAAHQVCDWSRRRSWRKHHDKICNDAHFKVSQVDET